MNLPVRDGKHWEGRGLGRHVVAWPAISIYKFPDVTAINHKVHIMLWLSYLRVGRMKQPHAQQAGVGCTCGHQRSGTSINNMFHIWSSS